MRIKTNDGDVFAAEDPAGIVRLLHKSSLAPARSDSEFMAQTAGRVFATSGQRVRWSEGPEAFLVDLIDIGLIEMEEK